jgi:hypothetical protein
MIVSIHIAELGLRDAAAVLLRPPKVGAVPGLTYAETLTTAPLGEPLLPPKEVGRVGMLAAWESDAALDRFDRSHPQGKRLDGGWQVRLRPLRVFGSWRGLPGLPASPLAVGDDEPVGVLTLGRLRLRRTNVFRRAAAPAEQAAIENPALLAGTGLARPPRLVATFSLWRAAAEMREYAVAGGGRHSAAMAADRVHDFHRESAFVRFRPYASRGNWDGRDPLAGLSGANSV